MSNVHYGIWHDNLGWWFIDGTVWYHSNEAIARAQLDCVRQIDRQHPEKWRIRKIEEWARMFDVLGIEEGE